MRSIRVLSFGGGKTAALIVFTLAAGAISLRADMACIGDCEQSATSHLSGISGSEDVEDGVSGFDIFFKPGVPTFLIAPSSLSDQLNSSDNSGSDGSGGGLLSFLGGGGLTEMPLSESSSSGFSTATGDPPIMSLLNQVVNSSGPGTLDPPAPDPPAPTPEPRYSGLAMLGLGGAVLRLFRKLRPSRQA